MSSATQRTLKYLRDRGFTCCIAEYYHAFARIRKDLFGWIDIVALKPGRKGVFGIQTTTGSNLAARITKAEALPAFHLWLKTGNEAIFVGWRKIGPRGKMKRWQPLIRRFPDDDIFQ